MKILAFVFSLLVALTWACSNLPKYSPCDTQENPDCKCSRGLACKVTREMFLDGLKVQVKQCMPVNERVVVEQLTEDDVRETLDPGSTAVEQTSRFYPGKVRYCRAARETRAASDFSNRPFVLQSFHKCGCMDGLVCKTTTQVTLPIIKVPFPIRQCVPKDDIEN
ncbi:PREDICTED: uncharacterized protein LOC107357977 [Acropora digitifera]|uniref:uncharacterized protein LOC107357977 n=1 Tax=Acropora digitifera TaxID=70779 RepID=UPI00077A5458|nr:PREDICTED: uncharacterized protein LOC107357977 [Acropora digitifera]